MERKNGCEVTRQTTLFEGKTDKRQAGDIKVSRFRSRYRKLSSEEIALHDEIKNKAEELEHLFFSAGQGRYQSIAITKLEEAVMFAVKQLTS